MKGKDVLGGICNQKLKTDEIQVSHFYRRAKVSYLLFTQNMLKTEDANKRELVQWHYTNST